ncbi:MAG: cysteine peptidase family C39 domain-containing protein [Bacillota bacterium]|nr:cysteine peptidase family C39 domain-containing protein [Bacillota bacterium]
MKLQLLFNILLSVLSLFAGKIISQKIIDKRKRVVLNFTFFILCIPTLMLLIVPIFFDTVWIVELSAVRGSEFLTVLCGLFIGFVVNNKNSNISVILNKYRKYFYLVAILILIPQYINYFPIMVNYDNFKDEWRDGVCIQSVDYTCAPSCLATVFNFFGEKRTEAEVAKSMQTSRSGTSISQIVRYARENGFKLNCRVSKDLEGVKAPSILDVEVSGIGHVIVYLGSKNGKFVIGDPLAGKVIISKEQLLDKYKFSGLLLEFTALEKNLK